MKDKLKRIALAIPLVLVAIIPAKAVSPAVLEKSTRNGDPSRYIHQSSVSPHDVLAFFLSGIFGKERICDTLNHFEEMVGENKELAPTERKFLEDFVKNEKRRFVCRQTSSRARAGK